LDFVRFVGGTGHCFAFLHLVSDKNYKLAENKLCPFLQVSIPEQIQQGIIKEGTMTLKEEQEKMTTPYFFPSLLNC
jgi:hypothetical protein